MSEANTDPHSVTINRDVSLQRSSHSLLINHSTVD